MEQNNMEAHMMLDFYIYDYLVKRKLYTSAEMFKTEGKVFTNIVAMDRSQSFLFKWWSGFWDKFTARKLNLKQSEHVPIIDLEKRLPMEPSSIHGQVMIQPKSGLGAAGFDDGAGSIPSKGPLIGIDQLRPSLGVQVPNPNLPTQHQFLSATQQQAQSNLENSANLGDMDPHQFSGLPRGSMSAKYVQAPRKEGSISSLQLSSPQINMSHSQVQHPSPQQQDQLQSQQIPKKRRRIKKRSSKFSESTGTGNTVRGSLGSPIILDDMDQPRNINKLFLSNEEGDRRDLCRTTKQGLADPQKESSKFHTFDEVACIRPTNSRVSCCHFSSDGKLLASAGHDTNVVLWNTDTLQTVITPEVHTSIITDVRFRPYSTQLVTSSYDRTLRLWDAANPNLCLALFEPNASQVLSLDFHPKKTNLFCSSGLGNEIHYWNIGLSSYVRRSEGGKSQVRFHPRTGNLLAATLDKVMSIIDVETNKTTQIFQGHSEMVNYICWDSEGDYLASVSQSLAKVWSITSGDCVQEFTANANHFHSCVFHPRYPAVLMIGGNSSLELWNIPGNKCMTVKAHEEIVSALAQSPINGLVGSASHDSSVKLWK